MREYLTETQCLDCDTVYYRAPRCRFPRCPECGGRSFSTLTSEAYQELRELYLLEPGDASEKF